MIFRIIKYTILLGIIFYVLYALGYVDFDDYKKFKREVKNNTIYIVVSKKSHELSKYLKDLMGVQEKKTSTKLKTNNAKPSKSPQKSSSKKDEITEQDRRELNDLLEQY